MEPLKKPEESDVEDEEENLCFDEVARGEPALVS